MGFVGGSSTNRVDGGISPYKSASVYECGRTWLLHLRDKPIRTWELLRFHCKLEKSSDEVEDVKDDRPSAPHTSDRPFGLASNPLGEDSPCRIISIRLPQKKTPASTSATSTCFAAARAQRSWL